MLPAYIIQKNKIPDRLLYRGSFSIIQSTMQTLICTFFFSHPDYTVGTGISPVRLQKAVHGLYRRSGICVIRSTLPRRIPSLFFTVIIFTLSENVNTGWTFSHPFANIISMKISNILRTDKTLDFFFLYHWLGMSYSRTRARTCMEKRLFPVDIPSGWLCPAQSDRVLLSRMRRHTRNSCPAARTYCALFLLPSDCCVYRCLFRLVYAVPDHRKSIPRTFCHRDALS